MPRNARRALAVVALLVVTLQGALTAELPRPSGYVNDFASVLTEDDRAYLEAFLRALERDTTAEVVVATVTSLEGLSIEEYANRLFAAWGVGKKARDNGVLLLVAPAERRVRIEVGYGLEGRLPDALAGEIIRTAIVPEFQQDNMRRGIGRGLDRISRVVHGEAAAAARAPASGSGVDLATPFVLLPLFGTFVAFGGFAAGLGLRTKTIGPLVAATLFTAIPLFIAAMISPVSLSALLPLELLALVFGYRKGRSTYWTKALRAGATPGNPGNEPDGWVVGGTSGSSIGDSSDRDGSSFSSDFGGGSSGGGGASGRW